MITKIQTELYFGEFIKRVALELNIPAKATMVMEERGNGVVLYFYFYEKTLFRKKDTQTVIVTIPQKGDIRFAGAITNYHQFQYEPLRFLKYQIASGLDGFFKNETAYTEHVLDVDYGESAV